jgi:protein-S-isoprenylcysteine O-methyltransferase Ste14
MSMRKRRIHVLRWVFFLLLPASLFLMGPASGPESARDELIEAAVRDVGYVLLMVGMGIRMWSVLYIGQRKSRELITDGPYSLCRNPLYVGTLFIGLGAAFCFQSLPMGVVLLGAIVPYHLKTVLDEEKHLREIFGESFDEYCRRTPRFLPRPSSYHSPETVTVSVRSIRRAVVDSSGVLVIPPLAILVGILQEHQILPALYHSLR